MNRLSVFGSLTVVAWLALQTHALGWSNATCIAQLWSLNSFGQTPCLVSAYLSADCSSDNYWTVDEIGTTGPYAPPSGTRANICHCNSVQWNLLSACSMCQGGPSGSWVAWISYCSPSLVYIGRYPEPVPPGVAVPHWAYYDFTGTGVFNTDIAQQQTGPESIAVGSATASSPTTAPSSATTTGLVETGSATPLASNNTRSSSNTGAIAGGVVGGVLGLALIALMAFILVRKDKKDKTEATTDQYVEGGYNQSVGGQPSSAASMMGQYQPGIQHPGMASSGPGYKAHDPSDLSTFPTPSNNTTSHYPEPLQYSQDASQYSPGPYTGAPEV